MAHVAQGKGQSGKDRRQQMPSGANAARRHSTSGNNRHRAGERRNSHGAAATAWPASKETVGTINHAEG